MPRIIKDGVVVDDQWQVIALEDNQAEQIQLPDGPIIVPLALWKAHKEELSKRKNLGVWLGTDENAKELAEDAAKLPVIGLHFSVFMDGRPMSTAQLLRQRYGFSGELRAMGGFIRDQLFYMKRCGFNAFVFEHETDLEEAIKSLNDFSECYQASTDQPLPLFRRRA